MDGSVCSISGESNDEADVDGGIFSRAQQFQGSRSGLGFRDEGFEADDGSNTEVSNLSSPERRLLQSNDYDGETHEERSRNYEGEDDEEHESTPHSADDSGPQTDEDDNPSVNRDEVSAGIMVDCY